MNIAAKLVLITFITLTEDGRKVKNQYFSSTTADFQLIGSVTLIFEHLPSTQSYDLSLFHTYTYREHSPNIMSPRPRPAARE